MPRIHTDNNFKTKINHLTSRPNIVYSGRKVKIIPKSEFTPTKNDPHNNSDIKSSNIIFGPRVRRQASLRETKRKNYSIKKARSLKNEIKNQTLSGKKIEKELVPVFSGSMKSFMELIAVATEALQKGQIELT